MTAAQRFERCYCTGVDRETVIVAVRAGLRTVYVPHPKTWFREVEPIRPDGPATIEVPSFDRILSVISAD